MLDLFLLMKKFFKSSKAFTLIELLVVIAVLGVLAVAMIAAINPIKKINQGKDSNLKSDMGQIVNAMQAYYTSQSAPQYPANLGALVPSELKTLPVQQAGAVACASISPSGTFGAGQNYCYGTSATFDKAVIWGYIFDASVSPSTQYYCWDSTSGVFKTSAASAAQPNGTSLTCP